MNKIYLKPKKGLVVLKPDRKALNADGEEVADCAYWQRRQRDGEVETVKPVKKDK